MKRRHEFEASLRAILGFMGTAAAVLFWMTGSAGFARQRPDSSAQVSAAQVSMPKSHSAADQRRKNSTEKDHVAGEHPVAQPDGNIKILGHWVIEVRGTNGALVSHTEFENELAASSGANLLVQLLSRKAAQGFWEVQLYGGPNDVPCQPQTPAHACVITEPGTSFFADSRDLALSASASGETFILAGSVTAQRDANILWVATLFGQCPITNKPAAPCSDAPQQAFTTAFLSPAISVAAGQKIQVTVTIGYL